MIRFLARLIFRLWFRVRVRGTVEPHERLLLVSNHQSLLDGLLLGAFLPVQPIWVLHTQIARHWYVRLPMRFVPHLVVDSAHPLAMKSVIALVEAGRPVLIFPEGRVTTTGSLMKVYEGPAFVAARTHATVVPVHIEGAVFSIFSRTKGDFPRKWFPRVTVTIHPPATISTPAGLRSRVRHRMGANALRKLMQRAEFESREPNTIFPALLDAMAVYGRRRGILEDAREQHMTYAGLVKASLALGRIVSKHVPEGETAGVLLPNINTTAALLFGMFAMRRVPAMLNYTSGFDAMQAACRAAGVRIIFTSRAFLEKARLADAPTRFQGLRLLYLEDLRAEFGILDKLWLAAWAVWFPRRAARPVRPGDPAVVIFTSGSEGRPKGVALSHDNILSNLAQCCSVIEFAPEDRLMSALPLFHAFGLTIGIFLPLMRGSRVFLYTSPLHYRVIPELIYDRDCTVLFASSTFLGNYAKYANPFDFQAVRLVVAGAEKLAEDVRKLYMEKFGIRILEGYGVTETSPVVSVNTPMAYKTGSVGELFPGMEYRLEPVPGIEEAGLLHLRGPNVMLGYLSEQQPGVIQPVRSLFGDRWYSTGDVASVDADGFIRILGRVKRFAKIAGEMVSLDLVERLAYTASPQSEHAAVAVPEAGRGEILLLFTADKDLRRERLVDAARQIGAPELAVARRIVHLAEIPALGNGKKDYVTLNRIARDSKSQPAVQ
jgi:acyl-[acyl-carrier-protein]-phospholipid O-acyltransferase/long-chain-fatty-acid--[acyl-carrier-protein] ligase